jgi:hypothetical protein
MRDDDPKSQNIAKPGEPEGQQVDKPDVDLEPEQLPEADIPGLDADEADVPEVDIPVQSVVLEHEVEDVAIRPILLFGAAVLVAVVVVHVVLWGAMQWWGGRPLQPDLQLSPSLTLPQPVPGPGIPASPRAELRHYLDLEAQRLFLYEWVDEEAGTVRIPIDQAMQLLVDEGLPAREDDVPTFRLAPAHRLDSSGGLVPVYGAPEAVEVHENEAHE